MSNDDTRAGGAFAVPAAVVHQARTIQAAVGLEPEIGRVGGAWRLSIASDRVATTIDFRRRGSRWRAVASTLSIDGQAVPLAEDEKHLGQIFADPDLGLAPRSPREQGSMPTPRLKNPRFHVANRVWRGPDNR